MVEAALKRLKKFYCARSLILANFFVNRVKKMSVNEESSYKVLANNLYKFRVLNNLSQKELAEKSQIASERDLYQPN